jgi:hypothetical protein
MSLAVLLVVVGAIAATVASYAWQRVAAFAWVERVGGSIRFEELPEWVPERLAACWPDWARRIEVIALFNSVRGDLEQLRLLRDAKKVDFFHAPVNDVQMRPLGSFDRLECLQIDATNLTDVGVAPLSRCRSLQTLSMDMPWREDGKGIAVGDEGLKHLGGLPLEILGLSQTRVTDAGMDTLSHLPRLRELYLNGTQVTDAGLRISERSGFGGLSLTCRPSRRTCFAAGRRISGSRCSNWRNQILSDGFRNSIVIQTRTQRKCHCSTTRSSRAGPPKTSSGR